jgi:hypothetical protein
VFALVCAVTALFGLTRVSLAAKIAEASVDAGRLRQEIKTERLVTDQLEIERSVLASPARLQSIATVSMRMSEPAEVCYLSLPGSGGSGDVLHAGATASDDAGRARAAEALPDGEATLDWMLAAVMDMAAGEAEVLLVGDVGLASSR